MIHSFTRYQIKKKGDNSFKYRYFAFKDQYNNITNINFFDNLGNKVGEIKVSPIESVRLMAIEDKLYIINQTKKDLSIVDLK